MGKRVGYFSGCWDLFHIGHLRALQKAKTFCDVLVVGVNTDEMIVGYKGELPIIPYEQRREIISALRCVDVIVVHTSPLCTYGFDEYGVNIRIVGPGFEEHQGRKELLYKLKEDGIRIIVIPRTPNISTEKIREKIRCQKNN